MKSYFSYDDYPIDSTAQIRLLSCTKDDSGERHWSFVPPILVSTEQAPQAFPGFAALSYEWGDSEHVAPFVIDGKATVVRLNLLHFFEAFCSMRLSPDFPALFWIDSICIDQQNQQEKANQIRLLHTIYKSASCVLSWLGPRADYSQIGMQALENPKIQAPTYITKLLERRYWTRLWMVQEVVLGRQWFVACGWEIINGDCFLNLVPRSQNLYQYTSPVDKDSRVFKALNMIDERLFFKRNETFPLIDLLIRFFEHEATFTVDKIRGLLALCAESDATGTLHSLLETLANDSIEADEYIDAKSLVCKEILRLAHGSDTHGRMRSQDCIDFVNGVLNIHGQGSSIPKLRFLATRLALSRATSYKR